MVEISIGSIWFQLASLCFLSICICKNAVQIRILIILGNILMITNASLGWPFWPDIIRVPKVIALDSIIWGCLIAFLNLISLISEIKQSRNSFFNLLLNRKQRIIYLPDNIEMENFIM